MIRKLLSPKWYVPFLYSGIDYEKWPQEKQESYFRDNYDLPPMKDGDTTAFLLQQLTARQLREMPEMDENLAPANLESDKWDESWLEYVLRYGVKDWRSLFMQAEDGTLSEVRPEYEDTPAGRRLTQEAYESLCFFCPLVLRGTTAVQVVYMSRQ